MHLERSSIYSFHVGSLVAEADAPLESFPFFPVPANQLLKCHQAGPRALDRSYISLFSVNLSLFPFSRPLTLLVFCLDIHLASMCVSFPPL